MIDYNSPLPTKPDVPVDLHKAIELQALTNQPTTNLPDELCGSYEAIAAYGQPAVRQFVAAAIA